MKASQRPQRTCLGCGARDDQEALIRLVLREDGELEARGPGAGRGGYLHALEKCWEAFVRRKNVQRAFRSPVEREARERLIKILRQTS